LCRPDWEKVRPTMECFFTVENDLWHHKRIDEEIEKATALLSARSKGGKLGMSNRWHNSVNNSVITKPITEALLKDNTGGVPSPSPLAERESTHSDGNPTLSEVLFYASKVGLAPWKAEDWWREMDGCGWVDHNNRKIMKWQSVLMRVKTKWESDGRPTGPPKPKPTGNTPSKENQI